ncbi:MAG: glycosyltransferase [Patescibacteria group bacterium]|nr:glycosyltransferase [Patescibacteria group bacterium]
MCLNPSQILADDYLEKLLEAAGGDEEYACAIGKTMRLPKMIIDRHGVYTKQLKPSAENALQDLAKLKVQIIDTVGTRILPDLRSINIGEGEFDRGQFDHQMEVIGGSGCAILFRRSALEKVKIAKGEFFDGAMWMYKEDEELELRLALADLACIYTPLARSWYHRTSANTLSYGWLASGINRLLKSNKGIDKLYSSLHYDYIVAKYFSNNKYRFPAKIRHKIQRMCFLRHVWELLLENSLSWKKRSLWPKYLHALKTKQLSDLDPALIISWIEHPMRRVFERSSMNPKLSISILAFGLDKTGQFDRLQKEFFPKLLASSAERPIEVFFVLNEKESENFQKLEKEFANQTINANIKIYFIRQEKLRVHRGMTGYITPHNLAQNKLASGEFRVLLNEDIDLEPDTLERLVTFMEKNPDIGVVAPRVQYPNGQVEPMARRFPRLIALVSNRLRILKKLFPEIHRYYLRADDGLLRPAETDWVCGHLFVVRGDAWQKVGGKDERFFSFMSDTDICRRIWQSGWKVYYNPEITVQSVRLPSSRGGFFKFLTSKRMQVHLWDALLYFWKWRGR